MRGVLRSAKNVARGYSDVQIVVREATCNESGGPTTAQLEHIAHCTQHATMMADIAYILDKRLNDSGRNWRHVYKTLVVLEYAVVCGADSAVQYAMDRLHAVRTLREFVAVNERGLDRGDCVRAKSRDLYALLTDAERLAEARRTRTLPSRESRGGVFGLSSPPPASVPQTQQPQVRSARRRSSFEELQNCSEDEALRRALAASAADSTARAPSTETSLLDLGGESPAVAAPPARPLIEDGSARHLLDLDDASFSRALESAVGSKPSVLAGIDMGASNDIFGDAAMADPFGNVLPPPVEAPAHSGVHAIAIPARQAAEQTVGAKPVMPASFAPRYGNAVGMSGSAGAISASNGSVGIPNASNGSFGISNASNGSVGFANGSMGNPDASNGSMDIMGAAGNTLGGTLQASDPFAEGAEKGTEPRGAQNATQQQSNAAAQNDPFADIF